MAVFFSWRRMPALLGSWAAGLALLLGAAGPARAAEPAIPDLTARVTDLTQTLSAGAVDGLTRKLADLEQQKGAQIAVLIVPTTGSDSIERYAIRVFDQWKLGRKNVDDGILFIVAKDDRRLRIEVGYGLGGAVPDILAGRIIREQVTPLFQQGDFDGGIEAGVDSLVKLVSGEPLPPAPQSMPDGGEEAPSGMLLPLALMALMLPATLAAAGGALLAYFVFNSLAMALLGAVAAFILSLLGRAMRGRGRIGRASRHGGAIGGLGGFGGGFGGGGFGGGGGGSGGGGASGSW